MYLESTITDANEAESGSLSRPGPGDIARVIVGDASDVLKGMESNSVDLVYTSPPFEDARTYETGANGRKFKLKGQAWVDWLCPIIAECARVSRGLVLVNVSGVVRKHRYSYAPEWLCADLTRVHGLVGGPAPYAWTKNGIPGSGARHYHRRNWEPIYSFCLPDRLPLKWSDQLAFGKPCKYAKGGVESYRRKDGRREGSVYHGKRKADGKQRFKWYTPPAIAVPSNVVHCPVGGGHLGSKLSHQSEAPMPESLAERFVRWYCPPYGVVLDPFAGSGTTLAVALKCGRRSIGIELRDSMADVARQRVQSITMGMC